MSTKKSKPMTYSEHVAQMKRDGTYDDHVKKAQERDRARREQVEALAKSSRPLVEALRAEGLTSVNGVWDLVNTAAPYDSALPVLIQHLTREYPEEILSGIARALAVPAALPYRAELIRLFRQSPPLPSGLRFSLGIAIAGTTNAKNLNETIELARDPSMGTARLPLLRPIRMSRQSAARAAIDELRKDPELATEIGTWRNRRTR